MVPYGPRRRTGSSANAGFAVATVASPQRTETHPTLSGVRTRVHLVVILPALNEERTIREVVRAIPSGMPGIRRITTVVVDDGSTDRTSDYAAAVGARVVRHPENLGVGAAFATGVETALRLGADIVVNMDSDGQFHPRHIAALLEPIVDGRAGFVTCTRFGDAALEPRMPWIKRRGNAWMASLVNAIVRPARPFTDVSCGFRAYTRETLLLMNLFGRFTYTQETFLDLAAKNVAMAEVPIPVRGVRKYGESRVARSILRYALQTSAIILRTVRDYRPLAFFGSIGAATLAFGLLQTGFVGVHWLRTGATSPWRSLIVTGGVTLVTGFLLVVLALLADMQGRNRRILDRILYHARKREYDPPGDS